MQKMHRTTSTLKSTERTGEHKRHNRRAVPTKLFCWVGMENFFQPIFRYFSLKRKRESAGKENKTTKRNLIQKAYYYTRNANRRLFDRQHMCVGEIINQANEV